MSGPSSPLHRWDLPDTRAGVHPSRRLLGLLRPAGRAYFNHRYEIHQHGIERVPDQGACILASNHVGLLDGPLMAAFAPRLVHALAKKEMFRGRTGVFLRAVGQIPLSRHDVDPSAIKDCLLVLRRGGVVGIYPEGARGAGEMEVVHPGVAYLGLVTGAPIIPLAVFGTREPGSDTDSVPAPGARFDFVYGAPVYLEARPWPRTQAEVRRAASELRTTFQMHLGEATAITGRALPGPIGEGTHP